MIVLLFLLVLLAIAGILGAVLKAVAVIVIAATLSVVIIGYVGWRAIRRQLRRAQEELGLIGGAGPSTTDVRVGRITRSRPSDDPPAVDDRY